MVLVEVLVCCLKLGFKWEQDAAIAFVALNTLMERFPIWRRLELLLCTSHRSPVPINWPLIFSSMNFLVFRRRRFFTCWASSGGGFQFSCWCGKWSSCPKIHRYSRITRLKAICYRANPCLSGHTLDLVITRADATDSFVYNISVLEQPISDHKVICFNLNLIKPSNIKKTNKTIKLKNFDFEKFIDDVIQRSGLLEEILDSRSVVNEYDSVLQGILDDLAPVRTLTVTLYPNAP